MARRRMIDPGNITEEELYRRIARKHYYPHWATFRQVRSSRARSGHTTLADAISISLDNPNIAWVLGFEIKLTNADLKQELRYSYKHEYIKQYCDQWWLVISEVDVLGECVVREDWGILVADGVHKLRVIREAPTRKTVPLDPGFVASVLRRAFLDIRNTSKED